MKVVNMHEAKTHLSRLVEGALAGDPFVIARAGRPLVRVEAIVPVTGEGRLGFMAGRIEVPDDFDTMGRDKVADLFEGA